MRARVARQGVEAPPIDEIRRQHLERAGRSGTRGGRVHHHFARRPVEYRPHVGHTRVQGQPTHIVAGQNGGCVGERGARASPAPLDGQDIERQYRPGEGGRDRGGDEERVERVHQVALLPDRHIG